MPTTSNSRSLNHRRLLRRLVAVVVVAAIIAAITVALWPSPIEIDVYVVDRETLTVRVTEDGRTRVKDRYVVSAPVSGYLARVTLEPGDRVKADDALARIVAAPSALLDSRTRQQAEARLAAARASERRAAAEMKRAREALQFAERELSRAESLWTERAIAEQALTEARYHARMRREEVASAEFGRRVAAQEIKSAQAAISQLANPGARNEDELTIVSPVDGTVLEIRRESEGVVAAGTPILVLGNPRSIEVVVDLLSSAAVAVEVGSRVEIENWGGERPLSGRVSRVEPAAFTKMSALGIEEQRVNVIIDLDDPYEEWQSLGDGYRVDASILIWEAADQLVVPGSALFRHGEEWALFVIDGDRAHRTVVEVGKQSGGRAQILGGLEQGTQIVQFPSDRIVDGSRVVERAVEKR